MKGKVATIQNQIIFFRCEAKRLLGISKMAQNVGIIGPTKRTIKSTGSTDID
jgi:hypothetical protein